jgi:hypothetical protein
MSIRVGINGFGRIGRNFFRAAKEQGADIDFVAANDLGSVDMMAHLLKNDSVLGRLRSDIKASDEGLTIDGDTFKMGTQSVRVVGIDTAEAGEHARCAREASQAEASTVALQHWLNRASFRLTARIDEPIDRYGRSLRTVIMHSHTRTTSGECTCYGAPHPMCGTGYQSDTTGHLHTPLDCLSGESCVLHLEP